MNVAALQFDIAWENKPDNFEKVRRLLVAAAPEKGSLVVLPEMFATGFSMNAQATAELAGGETAAFLAGAAADFGVCLVAGVATREADGQARNQALIFSPAGALLATYTKMRPFTLGGEPQHYPAGNKPQAFRWQECTVSPFICYDLRFPEIFRAAALTHRPELFLVVANWPDRRMRHWTLLLQARAIENQAYVVGVNRIGTDPFLTYAGGSIIVNPHGEIVADAGAAEGWISARLDLANLKKYRAGLPFLDDLQPAL